MKQSICSEWKCPQCEQLIGSDMQQDLEKIIGMGRQQVEFTCPECGEPLMADAYETDAEHIEINEMWIYD